MSFSEDFATSCGGAGMLLHAGQWRDQGARQALHSADYDFNDELLPIGSKLWASFVRDRLQAGNSLND